MVQFLEILAIGYIILWLGTSIWCASLGTTTSFFAGVFLSIIFYGIYNHNLWLYPQEMLSFHALILFPMMLTPRSKFWRWFFSITFFMFVADLLWFMMPDIEPTLRNFIPEMGLNFPYTIFWWQSLLYILFVLLCAHTLILNYHTHKLDKLERKLEHGNIWESVGHLIVVSKRLFHSKGSHDSVIRKNR